MTGGRIGSRISTIRESRKTLLDREKFVPNRDDYDTMITQRKAITTYVLFHPMLIDNNKDHRIWKLYYSKFAK